MKRECGECFACCIAFSIDTPQLVKPSGVECGFVNREAPQGACSIYEKRPGVCSDYACTWLQGDKRMKDAERPDKMGAVFDYRSDPIPGWYVREMSDVLSNPTSRASQRLLLCKKEMYTTYGKCEVVAVTRYDGKQYAYLPNGAIETSPTKVHPIKCAPPESFIRLRRK